MATNGNLNFTNVNKVTFEGVGAAPNAVIDTTTGNIGVGVDSPAANLHVVGNCFVSTNMDLGGVLNMGVVNVAARHTLEAITALGASTPSTLTLTNTGTSLVASGSVDVTGTSSFSDDLTVGTDKLFVDVSAGRIGVGTTSPSDRLHIYGTPVIQHQETYSTGTDNSWYIVGTWEAFPLSTDIGGEYGANLLLTFLGGQLYGSNPASKSEIIARIGNSSSYRSIYWRKDGEMLFRDVRLRRVGTNSHTYDVCVKMRHYTNHTMRVECSRTTSFTKKFTSTTEPLTTDTTNVTAGILLPSTGTSGNLGVGAHSPINLLHLHESDGEAVHRSLLWTSRRNNGQEPKLGYLGTADGAYASGALGLFKNTIIGGTENEAVRIQGNGSSWFNGGDVGIGTSSSVARLHVERSGAGNTMSTGNATFCVLENQEPNYGKYGLFQGVHQGNGTPWLQSGRIGTMNIVGSTSDTFNILLNPNGSIIVVNGTNYSSDDRIKSNEQYIEHATETLLKLKPQTYDKKSMTNTGEWKMRESGLIAQDVWYDTPELRHLVSHDKNADIPVEKPFVDDDPTKDPDYSSWGEIASLNYEGLIAYLIKSNQEIYTELQAEKEKSRALAEKVETLEDNLVRFIAQTTARLAS